MTDLRNGEYYAKGSTIWRAPIVKDHATGGSSISVGFPVCTVSEYIGTDGVVQIVAAFNSQLRE